MTRELLNTLYVTTPGALVRLDHDTLKVEQRSDAETQISLRVPLHHLGAVVLFGRTSITGEALRRCAMDGRAVVLLDESGRFQARVVGPTSGNVLLRQAQYQAQADPSRCTAIARMVVAGKIRNSRATLLRAARNLRNASGADPLREAADTLASALPPLREAADLDTIRGVEGQAAAAYFNAFPNMITTPTHEFAFRHRSRRPPRDRVNALLSFVYALLTGDCTSAVEGVGLDPQFGYLHALRPGRPALALDLVEEFRSCLADRLVLSLINRRQIRPEHFEDRDGGSTRLTKEGRKLILAAYQKRKQEAAPHPLLKNPTPIGLIPHLQARLLARHLRGDLDEYPPFLARS